MAAVSAALGVSPAATFSSPDSFLLWAAEAMSLGEMTTFCTEVETARRLPWLS